jgi:uncharacterized protein YndB with AHSA1/START domain
MSQLQVAAEQTAKAPPEIVWALVCDADRYAEWGPWSASGYQRPGDDSPHGPGAVRWLRSARRAYLRYVTVVERVVESAEPAHLAYTVIGGMPVRNYRSDVTLTPAADGQATRIRWTATWDSTVQGRLVWRSLRGFFPEVVADLAAAAERQAGRAGT